MDAQTFYAMANYSSLQNSIITEHLTDYENTIADKATALKEFGNLQRNPMKWVTCQRRDMRRELII